MIEIKNRVSKRLNKLDTPPLYDQIQLVTYMIMLGISTGDLVSVISERSKEDDITRDVHIKRLEHHHHSLKICPAERIESATCDICNGGGCRYYCPRCDWDICRKCLEEDDGARNMKLKVSSGGNIVIHREYLDETPHWHQSNWIHHVLPKLVCFFKAIKYVREDDAIRYRYLISSVKEKEMILRDLCPHFTTQ